MGKYIKQIIAVGILVVIWGVVQWPDERMHIVFCDVGQGDASLVSLGKAQIVIDTGPSEKKLMECLQAHMPYWDKEIELMVLSHMESDHIGGAKAALEAYEVDTLLVGDWLKESESVKQLIDLVAQKGVKVLVAGSGEKMKLGELGLQILWPMSEGLAWNEVKDTRVLGAKASLNEESVVVKVSLGEFDVLFTGDIGSEQELALVESGVLTPVEILKMAHHGSKYSSSVEFLEEVRPGVAVVMAGKNNSYGHPAMDTLKRFDVVGSSVLRTDEQGEIEIISDGEKYFVK